MATRLHIDYTQIRRRVGKLLNWKRNPDNWTTDNESDFSDILMEGLRMFYYPQQLGDEFAYTWTFLRPNQPMQLESGQAEYSLPPNFDTFFGSINYDNRDSNEGYPPIKVTNFQRIQRFRSNEDITGPPVWAALIIKRTDQQRPQEQNVVFYPTPNSSYRIHFQFHALPDTVDANNPFPLGGDRHAETIMSAILAAAENQLDDDGFGNHYQKFLTHLQSSIAADIKRSGDHLGYNDNFSEVPEGSRSDLHRILISGRPLYNGQAYGSDL